MESVEFKEGNLRELWRTSLPLMLSWLSLVAMTFIDRLYLARYSLDALNSCVTASLIVWAFTFSFQSLCEIVEVFVAQYNGAKRYTEIGRLVWQMLWVSCASVVFFIPTALLFPKFFFGISPVGLMQADYFVPLVLLGPFFGILGATSGFFIGQGQTRIITYVAIVGNALNILLDPLLIFGYGDLIPSMGVRGASLATGVGVVVQALILFTLFARRKLQEKYRTDRWEFNYSLMLKCLKVGAPVASFLFFELAGWSLFYSMMAAASPQHILIVGICQTVLILLCFFGTGIQKGIAAVTGNLIGANLKHKIPQAMRAGLVLNIGYALLCCIPLILFPDAVIDLFMSQNEPIEGNFSHFGEMEILYSMMRTGLLLTAIYLFLENIKWQFSGVLSAAGDTLFLMVSGLFVLWSCMVMPTYIWITLNKGSTLDGMVIWVIFASIAVTTNVYRYWSGQWDKEQLITPFEAA